MDTVEVEPHILNKPKCELLPNGHIIKRGSSIGGSIGSSGSTSSGGGSDAKWLMGKYLNVSVDGFDHFLSVVGYPSEGLIFFSSIIEVKMWATTTVIDENNYVSYADDNNNIPMYVNDTLYNSPTYPLFHYRSDGLPRNQTIYTLWKVKFRSSDNSILDWYFWQNRLLPQTLNTNFTATYSNINDTWTFSNANSGSIRVLEFNRPSYTPYSSIGDLNITQEQKDIMYNCTVRNQEYGIYDNALDNSSSRNRFTAWSNGTVVIKVIHNASTTMAVRNSYNTAIDDWITLQNSTISGSGVSFSRNDNATTPHFTVRTGTHLEMFGFDATPQSARNGGSWQTWSDSSGWTYQAEVKLNNQPELIENVWTYASITVEEMMQTCGCGGDLTTRADCINTDFNWIDKNPTGSYNAIDTACNKLIYNTDLRQKAIGSYPEAFAILLNPSNGLASTSGTTRAMTWLKPETEYNFRIYQVNSSNQYTKLSPFVSRTTGTTTFSVGNPSSANISQSDPQQHNVDISWTAGSNATGHDVQWSNTTTMPVTPQFENQQLTSYTNIDVSSFGNKYFQVRARMDWGDAERESSWINFSPYPITVIFSINWQWSYTIETGSNVQSVSGKNIYIMSYTEWNNFTSAINQVRTNNGFSSYTFTSVASENNVTKEIINEAVNAINGMSAYFTGSYSGNTISLRITGDNILAAQLYKDLRNFLNSISSQ